MFQQARKHLTPATFIGLLALVFALTGGAFAATGHGGGSGSKATASVAPRAVAAKSKGKTGPRGPRGVTGPAGKNGTNGTNGVSGATGPAGPKGEPGATGSGGEGKAGESVSIKTLKENQGGCEYGGAEFSNSSGKASACNGEEGTPGTDGTEGSPWTDGGTLPAGSTETGTWFDSFAVPAGEPGTTIEYNAAAVAISFPIRLAKAIGPATNPTIEGARSVGAAGNGTTCPGTVEEPKAAPGDFCIYQGPVEEEPAKTEALSIPSVSIVPPGAKLNEGSVGTGTSGAVAHFHYEGEGEGPSSGTVVIQGSWAVTAP